MIGVALEMYILINKNDGVALEMYILINKYD